MTHRVKSLNGLNHLHKAESGANGGKQKMHGIRGKDAVIQVCFCLLKYESINKSPVNSICCRNAGLQKCLLFAGRSG